MRAAGSERGKDPFSSAHEFTRLNDFMGLGALSRNFFVLEPRRLRAFCFKAHERIPIRTPAKRRSQRRDAFSVALSTLTVAQAQISDRIVAGEDLLTEQKVFFSVDLRNKR
jgi:hypothetical protein